LNRIPKGILYILLSCFFFSLMGAIVKILGERLGSLELVFFRNLFGIFIIGASLLHRPAIERGGRVWMLIFRGIWGSTALLAYFYNITQIPLATAFTLTQTTPLFIALFSLLLLHESVKKEVWLAIFLGFGGVLLLYPPTLPSFSPLIGFTGLYSGLGAALAYLSISELKNHYENRTIILSLTLSGTLIPFVLLFFGGEEAAWGGWVMPTLREWVWISALGIISTLGQIFLTKAYASMQPSILGAVSYVTILFTTGWGLLLGDSLPSLVGALGMILIAFGGILSAHQGAKRS